MAGPMANGKPAAGRGGAAGGRGGDASFSRRASQNQNNMAGGNSKSSQSSSSMPPKPRGLRPDQLGGVIFFCSKDTMDECIDKKLFGLPKTPHWDYVQHIRKGMPLFLFNHYEKKLYGVFEADSEGRLGIDPTAWIKGPGDKQYLAQVRVLERRKCHPISESDFKDAFPQLYFSPSKFMHELTHAEAESLGSLFNPLVPAETFSRHKVALASKAWRDAIDEAAKGSVQLNDSGSSLGCSQLEPHPGSSLAVSKAEVETEKRSEISQEEVGKEKRSEILQDLTQSDFHDSGFDRSVTVSPDDGVELSGTLVGEKGEQPKDSLADIRPTIGDSGKLVNSTNAELGVFTEAISVSMTTESTGKVCHQVAKSDVDLSLRSDELVQRNNTTTIFPPNAVSAAFNSKEKIKEKSLPEVGWEKLQQCLVSEDLNIFMTEPERSRLCISAILQMRRDILELQQENLALRLLLAEQQLQSQCDPMTCRQVNLASESDSFKPEVVEQEFSEDCPQRKEELHVPCDESATSLTVSGGSSGDIYIVGGYNGDWLEVVDIFSPKTNQLLESFQLHNKCQWPAACVLDGCIYVFGGADNTVEKYDNLSCQWMSCTSLKAGRRDLAGATVGDKIFAIGGTHYAIGGTNGSKELSDVEYYDGHRGVWLPCSSMLENRASLAATELDGVLYAIGGFANNLYINTMERFDPRESRWSHVAQMESKRGGLSAGVIDGKIYALGGFNGQNFLNSVEVFDPRANKWHTGDPMRLQRAYGGAAVIGNVLYLIGGLSDTNRFLDVWEVYKDGIGWKSLFPAPSVQRCWFSACVL